MNRRHLLIVGMLIARKANVNLADRQGVTPLAHARLRGQEKVAGMLVAAGGH